MAAQLFTMSQKTVSIFDIQLKFRIRQSLMDKETATRWVFLLHVLKIFNCWEDLARWEKWIRFGRWLCWEDWCYKCLFDNPSSQELLFRSCVAQNKVMVRSLFCWDGWCSNKHTEAQGLLIEHTELSSHGFHWLVIQMMVNKESDVV